MLGYGEMRGRSWVVTGGVGFIGYHVSHALLARGDEVTVIDDFSDAPYPEVYKRRNAADLIRDFAHLRIVTACVTDAEAIDPCFEGADGVIHLAGLAGVRPSIRSPAHYAHVNVTGTATVLEIARARGIQRVSFASSSSVYGNSTPLPANEDEPAIAPESPYGASKRCAELVAQSIAQHAPTMGVRALRFFTVYGPRQRPEMAIMLFSREPCARAKRSPYSVMGRCDATSRMSTTSSVASLPLPTRIDQAFAHTILGRARRCSSRSSSTP